MKQLSLIVLALLAFCQVSMAQQSKSDESLEFRRNWSLKLQGGASYTMGETDFGKLITPAFQLSTTYNFHPAMGITLGVGSMEGKGTVVVTDEVYKFEFVQINADYVLNLANLFGGFKHNRVVSPYVFAGIGLGFGDNNKEAAKYLKEYSNVLTHYWEETTLFAGRAGAGVDFWLSNKFALGLEANANCYHEKFNSKHTNKGTHTDWHYNLLAGLTYRFGGNNRPSEAYAAALAAEKEALELARKAEEARLAAEKKAAEEKAAAERAAAEKAAAEKAAAEKAAAEKAAAERAAMAAENSIDVFFTIGSAYINKVEGQKIETLAEWMKAHPDFNVMIVGYADKATGSSNINMKISENRTKAVKERLESFGVESGRISTESKGDTVAPFDENNKNRVVICTLK